MAKPNTFWIARPFAPDTRASITLRESAASCRGYPLWPAATQTVFGEGPRRAHIMMAGEPPGDREDRLGHPFVGPAGRLLDQALTAAGIDRREVYLSNAVKHFKWIPGGTRRSHKKPSAQEIAACRPWLEAEIAAVEPAGMVALGATAAQTLLWPHFRVTQQRGRALATPDGKHVVVAPLHPSAVLRGRPADRAASFDGIVADLRVIGALLEGQRHHSPVQRRCK